MKATLYRILSQKWLVDNTTAASFFDNLLIYNNSTFPVELSDNRQTFEKVLASESEHSNGSVSASDSVDNKYVAVVQLRGALMKDDEDCGKRGMNSIAFEIKKFKSDVNCIGLMLAIDSPGGTVDGTANLAREVSNFGKPTLAFVDGMAASAAYWIASQCDSIYLNHKLDQVGSIGVCFSYMDINPALERLGVKFHDIVADESPNKNLLFKKVKEGDYSLLKKELSEIYAEFKASINAKRTVADEAATGSMYTLEEAQRLGMVNGQKTFDECLALMLENSSVKNQNCNTMVQQFSAINSALGVESLEGTDAEGIYLNEEQLGTINGAIETERANAANAATSLDTATAQLQERDATIASLHTQVADQSSTIAQLNEQVVALQNRGPVAVSTKGSTNSETGEESASAREERLSKLAEEDFDAYLAELSKINE